jgi:hypothetical protein
MQTSTPVGNILEAISILDFEDQLFVAETLQKRMVELRRTQIAIRVKEAEENYRLGRVRTCSVEELMMASSIDFGTHDDVYCDRKFNVLDYQISARLKTNSGKTSSPERELEFCKTSLGFPIR